MTEQLVLSPDAGAVSPPAADVDPQGRLFFLPEDLRTEKELIGIYDASRLRQQRPDIEQVIVEMVSQGQSVRAIKRVCRVHHYTIAAVAAANGIAIDTGRERVCAELRLARQMLAESIVDACAEGKLKPEALGVTLGIVVQNLELLSGHATARVESVRVDAPRSWEEFRAKLREKTGLEAGENGEMRQVRETVVHELEEVTVERVGEQESLYGQKTEVRSVDDSGKGEGGVEVPPAGLEGPTH